MSVGLHTGDITWIVKLGDSTVNVSTRIGTMYMAIRATTRRIEEGDFPDREDDDLTVEMWEGGRLSVTFVPFLPESELEEGAE